jgi:hypothetical protein
MKTWLYGRFAPGHLSHFFDAFGPKAKPFIFKAMRSWTNSSHHCKILGLQFNKKKTIFRRFVIMHFSKPLGRAPLTKYTKNFYKYK